MTGLEPAAIATTAAITAASSGLTKIAVDIFKDTSSGFLDRFRSGVDERTRTFIFQAFQKYVENYRYRHCQLKVLGMRRPVDLEDVYTTVRLLDSQAIQTLESIEALEKAYREHGRRGFRRGDEEKAQPGVNLARAEQYLMVLGSPGAGKSTFLRKMGLEALNGRKGGLNHRCIPVFLELKRLTESTIDLKELIIKEFRTCNFPRAEDFTNRALKQGRLLILLDGLDEVPTDNLNNAIHTIQDFVDKYKANRYIASCRIAAYRTSFRQFTDVAMADFDDTQIEQFITNWFSSDEDKQSKKAQTCWDILQRSENQSAKELAQTPLLLTFLCLVYGRAQRFPENRAQLYSKALRILLEEWAAEKAIMQPDIYEGLSTELEEMLLAEIACEAFIKDQLFFTRRELVEAIKGFLANNLNVPQHLDGEAVLNAIAVQQGIFIERAEDAYTFSHLTLQEYLTAQYIDDHRRIPQLINDHLFNHQWREVFLLIAGLMRGGADELLDNMCNQSMSHILKSPNLHYLIQWSDEVTAESESSCKPFIKRLGVISIAIEISFNILLVQDYGRGLILHNRYQNILSLCTEFSTHLGLRFEDKLLQRDQHRAASMLAKDRASKTLNVLYGSNIMNLDLFSLSRLSLLLPRLEALVPKKPSLDQTDKDRMKLANLVIDVWLDTLKINPERINFSANELNMLLDLLYANELMVKCKESAVRVSPKVWAEIEERMLTVR